MSDRIFSPRTIGLQIEMTRMSDAESAGRSMRPDVGWPSLHRTEPAAFNRQVEAVRTNA